MEWVIFQLLSYEWAFWLFFLSLAFLASSYFGWPGLLLSLFLLPGVVGGLDFLWIRHEMSQPGWAGDPDMDGVFYFGVLLRILVIGLVLLPVSGLGLFLHLRYIKPTLTVE